MSNVSEPETDTDCSQVTTPRQSLVQNQDSEVEVEVDADENMDETSLSDAESYLSFTEEDYNCIRLIASIWPNFLFR